MGLYTINSVTLHIGGGNFSFGGYTNLPSSVSWNSYSEPPIPTQVATKSEWENMITVTENARKEELPKMNIDVHTLPEKYEKRYRVACTNTSDLLPDRIMKNLSILKSRLYFECFPSTIKTIECKMTPNVKTNIIMAYRKLNMYGKKTPFIPCFDEYGRILEEQVRIDTLQGMTITVVNPEDYGELYLDFTAVVIDYPF